MSQPLLRRLSKGLNTIPVFVFVLGTLAFTKIATINTLQAAEKSPLTLATKSVSTKPGQVNLLEVQVQMPKGFHLYRDQLKFPHIDPQSYQIGQPHIQPEVEFFDKYSKKKRIGIFEKGSIFIQVEAPEKVTQQKEDLTFDLRYQICSEEVCYLPQTERFVTSIRFEDENKNPLNIGELKKEQRKELKEGIVLQFSENLLVTFLLVFVAGILTSFTPCIFPMIPITLSVLGHDAEKKSRLQNFIRSVLYVHGIALTYSVLGVAAAMTGSLFGNLLANKFVLAMMVALFALMALAMWGAFDLQVPAFIRKRFGASRSSEGYIGAFVMGLLAGIVASPCVGPVLVSILSYVSTTKSVILGFSLLFTYAMGLGLIFIVLGIFGQFLKHLPRSGPWMNFIKFVLGFLMVCTALYYLKFVISERWWFAILGFTFAAISVWQGAFQFRKKKYTKQSFFLAKFVLSLTIFILAVVNYDYLKPLTTQYDLPTNNEQLGSAQTAVRWLPYTEENLKNAVAENKPVLIDFFAEWCQACHELKDKTFSRPEFKELAQQFVLLVVDATEDTPEVQKIIKHYDVKGLPTVLFINKKGDILNDLTFTQFLPWEKLQPKMQKALEL